MKYGPETEKAHKRRLSESFYSKYCTGQGLDIGFAGAVDGAQPIWNAIGVDKDYPGYDGNILPFTNESQDFVYSSHCLEHIDTWQQAISEWYRVIKLGGYLIITVPHKFLYEKKASIPSNWNGDHRRFYTPASLMSEIEASLAPNSYRVEYLKDCAEGFDYSIGPELHSGGEYQIELILKKIAKPSWELK